MKHVFPSGRCPREVCCCTSLCVTGENKNVAGESNKIDDRGLVVEVDPSPALPVSMTTYAYTFEPMHDPQKQFLASGRIFSTEETRTFLNRTRPAGCS